MIKPRQEAIRVIEPVDASQQLRFHEVQRDRRRGSADEVHEPLSNLITGLSGQRLLQRQSARQGRLLLDPHHRSTIWDRRDRFLAGGGDRSRRRAGQDGLDGAGAGAGGPGRGALLVAVDN